MRRFAPIVTALMMTAIASTALAQRPGGPQPTNPLIRVFDVNGDGVISGEEIATASDRLKALDTGQDGKLTSDELRRVPPLGRRPGGRGGPMADASRDLEKDPLAKSDAERRVLSTLEEMWRGERFRNVSAADGRLLRMLTESIGAKRVVEIGTSTGESALWFALALRSTGGELLTHEIDSGRAAIARRNFKAAGVDDIITLIEGDAHENVSQHTEPIDILFLDADKEGYIDYMNKLLPILRPGGLIIAHNMNTRQADPKFVQAITEDPKLETLILIKEGMGVGVTLKKR